MLKRYLYLLKLTLIEAMVIAKDYDNPIQILFSCRILALATFRIPSFGDIVMSALLDLQPPLHLSLPDIRFDVLKIAFLVHYPSLKQFQMRLLV